MYIKGGIYITNVDNQIVGKISGPNKNKRSDQSRTLYKRGGQQRDLNRNLGGNLIRAMQ
jgi:hypothetical protein